MAFVTIASGLTLRVPTSGTQNWATTLKSDAWDKISSHDHSGTPNGQKIGTAAIAPNTIVKDNISKNLGEYQVADALAASITINWNLGRIHVIDLSPDTTNVALTLSNPVEGARYTIKVIAGATKTLSFVTAVKWPQGENPTDGDYYLSQATGAIDKIELYYDGASYLATWEVGLA